MVIALVVVFILFAFLTDGRLVYAQNLSNLMLQNGYVLVMACGMLLCILTGGNIDLSVGSVVGFTGAIGALLIAGGMNMWLAVIIMLAIGLAIGAFQAYWIAYVRVPPFITTLAGMLIFRGLSNVVLNGRTQSISDQAFKDIFGGGATCYIPDPFGGGTINVLCLIVGVLACLLYLAAVIRGRMGRVKKGYAVDSLTATVLRSAVIVAAVMFFTVKLSQYKGIPAVLVWVALVIGAYGYLTSKTTIGRHLYAVGGNEKATQLSGINTNKIYFIAYANMGLLAGLCGLLNAARVGSVNGNTGTSFEMDAIGACFIGGASAYGGTGTVPGVIIGALLMGVLNLGMSIMGVDQNMQKVVKGLVLLAAVIFDVVSKRKAFIVK